MTGILVLAYMLPKRHQYENLFVDNTVELQKILPALLIFDTSV